MWTFWPALVAAFAAAFSLGSGPLRRGCDLPQPKRLVCRTSDIDGKPTELTDLRTRSQGQATTQLIRGAAIEDLQWTQPPGKLREDGTREPARTYPFALGIVEFDEQGKFWSTSQRDHVEGLVTSALQDRDTLLVTFIHGWKNNCETCNGNLACFREALASLAAVEGDLADLFHRPPRHVVGIYIAWRGKTMRIPYVDSLSVFSRKATADRVGGRTSDVTAFLSRLNELKMAANDPKRRTALTTPETQLVVVGHSFGGDLLFGAVAGHLSAQLGASDGSADGLRAQPFADLTVLVNPAFEASLYRSFAAWTREQFLPAQLPLLVTVQTTNDWVTHYAFPVERAIISLPGSTTSSHDYGSSLSAVGHDPDYYTHTLCQPGKPGCPGTASVLEATLLDDLTTPPTSQPCGCSGFEASRDFHAALLNSVRHALQDAKQSENQQIGAPMKRIASDLEPFAASTRADAPLLVVRATPDIVDGHSGIYRGQFFDFLVNMVVRTHLLEHPELVNELRKRPESQ
jgi:hypothetical protein